MAHHHFKRLARVGRDVTLYGKRSAYPGRIRVRMRPVGRFTPGGDPLWQTVVFDAEGKVREVWEADLWLLRKITVGYLPQMARYLGSARSFQFWKPAPRPQVESSWRYIEADSHDGVVRSVPVKELVHDEVTNLDFSKIEERYLASVGTDHLKAYLEEHLNIERPLLIGMDSPGGPVDELVKQMREAGMSVDMEAAAKAESYCNSPVKPDDWDSKTEREKVEYQLSVDVLVDHFPVFHAMLERVVGRPVFTHEIGPELLKEIERDERMDDMTFPED